MEKKCFVLGIDGLVDMKLIYGTTAAEKKAKQGKEGKVKKYLIFLILYFHLQKTFLHS